MTYYSNSYPKHFLTQFFCAILCSTALSLSLIPASAKPKGELIDKIAAVVEGNIILASDLEEAKGRTIRELKRLNQYDAMASSASMDRRVLDQLINEKLIEKEIQKRNLSANDSTIDNAIATVMEQNKLATLSDFERVLRDEGMSMQQYRETLKKQIETSRIMQMVVKPKVKISDEDVEQALKNKLGHSDQDSQLHLKMIFRKKPKASLEEINAIKSKISKGKKFEEIAKEFSQGPGRENGGDIGVISVSDLAPELASVASTLKTGDISEPIDTANGFYLLKCESRKAKEVTTAVREKVRNDLANEALAQVFDQYLVELRAKANIKNLL